MFLNTGLGKQRPHPPRTLADLAPELVYASTDLMGTGGDIVQVQRANGDTEDFTGAELYDGTYASFVSGTTGKITKIYNQGTARNLSPNRDLSQDVSANQPVVDIANKRFIFDDAFVYGPEMNFVSHGYPHINSSIFFASRIFVPATNSTDHDIPLLSIYNAETGSISLSYGFVHGMHHRQITYKRESGTDGNDVYASDDSGGTPSGYFPQTTTVRAEHSITPTVDVKKTVFGRNVSKSERKVEVPPDSAVQNLNDSGQFNLGVQSDDKVRWGIGGFKTQATTKDIGGDFSLYASIAFSGQIGTSEVADLTRILGDL